MIEYRRLTAEDAVKMSAFADDQNTKYDASTVKRFLEQENTVGFGAVDGERIIGFAYGYRMSRPDGKCDFYLHAIDIEESRQCEGYGTALMQYIHAYAKKMGCRKMFLLTEEENKAACACYEKAGGKKRTAVLYEYH